MVAKVHNRVACRVCKMKSSVCACYLLWEGRTRDFELCLA